MNKSIFTEEGTGRTITAGGTEIHYHDVGEGDPVIFLHSYGPGSTAWITFHKNLPELSKHFRCIAMDMPNFAKSGPIVYNEPIHIFQARSALALMDALGIEKASIVGNSQGGQSALVFAYRYPDRINKLIWGGGHIGTGRNAGEYIFGIGRTALGMEEGIRASIRASQTPSGDNMRDYLLLHIFDENLITKDLIDYLISWHTGRPDLAEARSQSMGYIPYDHLQYLPTITAPTLMIWGRYDRTCQFEIGINALNHIPDSRLIIINNCGHWTPFEKPMEYNAHVLNFLQSD